MKIYIFLTLLLTKMILFAQNEYLNQVLILNEGAYDYSTEEILNPVTVGVYNPIDNSYNTVLEIEGARFSSDLIIDGSFFYVAADNQILKYDLNTFELLSSTICEGVRKLAVYDDYIIVSRGDYDPVTFGPVFFDSYLQLYLKDNLSLSFSFDNDNGPQWSTESLIVIEDKLYVAINNAYEWGNYKGLIGVVDLSLMNYLTEIDLGENGNNPINIMYKDNMIYTLNNKNWDGSSISLINTTDSEPSAQSINLSDVSAGCGVSVIRDEKFNYQKSNESEMYVFNLETLSQDGVEENLEFNYYGVSVDPLSGYLYAAIANFTDNSEVIIYDQNNNQVNSFIAGVAANQIVFDIRNTNSTSITEESNNLENVKNIDLLGKNNNSNQGLKVKISGDGSIKKQLIIKK